MAHAKPIKINIPYHATSKPPILKAILVLSSS
jgi:hypothetical protein